MGLHCSDMAFLHTTGLLRCQGFKKNCKRPTKVGKAKFKARDWKSQILTIFKCHCDHLVLCRDLIFSSFKVIKVKKVKLIAGAAFYHRGFIFALKALLQYPDECFESSLTQISAG